MSASVMASSSTAATEFGTLAPGAFARSVIRLTSGLPNNWLGLRVAILLRRFVTTWLNYPDGALDVVRWGVRLRLHPRDNGCEKNLLFTPQMYEPEELAELAAEIKNARSRGSGFVFIDIGANVGLFSFFVAACAGPSARILAVEPETSNLERLLFNLRANPGLPIRVAPVALASEQGVMAAKRDPRDRGGTRVLERAEPGTQPVEAMTLLQLLTRERTDFVDAIKIDVEGMEDVILVPFFRDAPESLWPRLIVIEDARASWKSDLFSLLATRDYDVVSRSRLNVILRRTGSAAQSLAS
jgi:FkbM family methyltransferase